MLDGVHLGTAHRNGGSQTRVGHGFCVDRDIDRLRQIHAPKNDACVRLGRAQGQLHALSAVQSHANGAGQGFEGALLEHPGILVSRAPSRLIDIDQPFHRHVFPDSQVTRSALKSIWLLIVAYQALFTDLWHAHPETASRCYSFRSPTTETHNE